jgi:hypothetical protein
MLQPLEERARQVAQIAGAAPDVIAIQHRDDLVVGLAPVDDLQAAEHPRPQQDLRVGDRPLADHTDVERIAVAPVAIDGEAPHPIAAVGLRYEAIERRRMRGGALRTVHPQIPGRLVHLILHQVERRDLDEGIDHARTFRPGLETVPRVGTPAGVAQQRVGNHLRSSS